ncbi:MAG: hypothetical protein ACFFDN_41330, partial [Candidatus Hodarchaeota archaeon]
MTRIKKHKSGIRVVLFLIVILMISFFPMNSLNHSNYNDDSNEGDILNDDFNQFESIPNLKLSLLGEDDWWDSDFKCR